MSGFIYNKKLQFLFENVGRKIGNALIRKLHKIRLIKNYFSKFQNKTKNVFLKYENFD